MRADRDHHEQVLHNTREETGNRDHQPLDDTCDESVASSPDNRFLEGTHEVTIEYDYGDGFFNSTHKEPGNDNRDKRFDNGTSGEPFVIEGEVNSMKALAKSLLIT